MVALWRSEGLIAGIKLNMTATEALLADSVLTRDSGRPDALPRALSLIVECHAYLVNASVFARDNPLFMEDISDLNDQVLTQQCLLESQQARIRGDERLEAHMADSSIEGLNMDLVWAVADDYKEAILRSREREMESEAHAQSRLGRLYGKVLKDKERAHRCYQSCVTLALSMSPRTFERDAWFTEAKEQVRLYQLARQAAEARFTAEDEAPLLAELRDEIAALKAAAERGASNLLKHIYETHPPKNKEHTCGKVTADYIKKSVKTALLHYSQDKAIAAGLDKKWIVLLGQICRELTAKHEMLKGVE